MVSWYRIKKRLKTFFLLCIVALIFAALSLYIVNLFKSFSGYSLKYYEPRDFERYEWTKRKTEEKGKGWKQEKEEKGGYEKMLRETEKKALEGWFE